jgi:hypothetical protein
MAVLYEKSVQDRRMSAYDVSLWERILLRVLAALEVGAYRRLPLQLI